LPSQEYLRTEKEATGFRTEGEKKVHQPIDPTTVLKSSTKSGKSIGDK